MPITVSSAYRPCFPLVASYDRMEQWLMYSCAHQQGFILIIITIISITNIIITNIIVITIMIIGTIIIIILFFSLCVCFALFRFVLSKPHKCFKVYLLI